jgi:hypothetical protein
MDYKKSSLLYKKRANSSNKIFQYKFSNNYVNKDQRKSKEININFSQRFKEIKNSNLNKSPIIQRLSLQNTNMLSFSKILKNKNTYIEKLPQKRDKNYYLNILNEIYLNDSHLSNKNKIIKFDKGNFNHFSKFRSSKNIAFKFGSKSTNKKYSLFSNEYRNKSPKKINNYNNINKKISKDTGNFSQESKKKKFNRKYLSTKSVSKFKSAKDKSIKNKSSFNDNEKNENLSDTLKDEKNNEMINNEIKSKKKICKLSNKNIKNDFKNNEKEETEMGACDTNKDISDKKTATNPKIPKFYKSCFFCCLTSNDKDDSYSDNI